MAKKHNRILSKRFWLTATAVISLMHPAITFAGDNLPARAQGTWQVGAVHNTTSGTPTYCAMANAYENKSVLAFARDKEQQGSIALELGDASLDPGKQYNVIVEVNNNVRREISAKAESSKSIILQIGQDATFTKALQGEGTLRLDLSGQRYAFTLNGFKQAFNGLEECVTELGAAKAKVVTNVKRSDNSKEIALEKQLSDVQKIVADLQAEKKTLEEKLQGASKLTSNVELSSKVSGFEVELKEMHLRNTDLTRDLSQKQHEIKELKLQIERSDADKAAIQARISELEGLLQVQNKVIKEQKDVSIADAGNDTFLQSELSAQKEKMAELRRVNLSLQQDLDVKSDQVKDLEAKIATMNDNKSEDHDGEVARLTGELEELRTKVTEIENVKNSLDAQLVEKQLLLEDGQELVSALKSEKAELVMKLQSRASVPTEDVSGRKDLEKLIKDQTANLQKLRQENLILQQRLETSDLSSLEVTALRSEKEALEKQLAAKNTVATNVVAEDDDKLQLLREENIQLQQQLEGTKGQANAILALKSEKERLQAQLNQTKINQGSDLGKLAKLEADVSKKTAALQALRQENLRVQQQLEESQQKLTIAIAAQKTEPQSKPEDIKRLAELDIKIQENLALKSDIEALKQSVDILKREKSNVELQVANYKNMKGAKNATVTKLEKVVSERSAQLAAIRAENITLQRELLGKEQKLAQLSGKVESATASENDQNQLANYKTDLMNTEKEVRKLQQEKSSYEAYIAELETSIKDVDTRKGKLAGSNAQDQKIAQQLANAQLVIDQQTETIAIYKEKLEQQTRLSVLGAQPVDTMQDSRKESAVEITNLRQELAKARSAAVASSEYLEHTRKELDKAQFELRSLKGQKQARATDMPKMAQPTSQPFGMTPRELVEPPRNMQVASKQPTGDEIIIQMEALEPLAGNYPQNNTAVSLSSSKVVQSDAVIINPDAVNQTADDDYAYAMEAGYVSEIHKPQIMVNDDAMVAMVEGVAEQQVLNQSMQAEVIKLTPPQSLSSIAEAQKHAAAMEKVAYPVSQPVAPIGMDAKAAANLGEKNYVRESVKEDTQNRTERFLDNILNKHQGSSKRKTNRSKGQTSSLGSSDTHAKIKLDTSGDAKNIRRLLHDAKIQVSSFEIDKYQTPNGEMSYQKWQNAQFTGMHETQAWHNGYHIKQYIDGMVSRYQNDCSTDLSVQPVHYENNEGYEIAIADIACPSSEGSYIVSGIFYGKQGDRFGSLLHTGTPETVNELNAVRDNLFQEVQSQIKQIIG